jgi:hypothetical protein
LGVFVSKPEFRNASGARYLGALFLERNMRDRSTVLYTLKETDDEVYPSLYRLYMESTDPTEYVFATTYFENWQHWADLCEKDWFIPIVKRWRMEKELQFRSRSLALLLEQALGGSREAVQVNKWIVEGGYTPKGKGGSTGRGRPSKEDISKAASQIAGDQSRLDEDYLRIVQ